MKLFFRIFIFIFLYFYTISEAQITTIAGIGASGFSPDGVSATGSKFGSIAFIAIDCNNNIYITDSANLSVRIDSGNIIKTFAISLYTKGIAIDSKKNIYLGDVVYDDILKFSFPGHLESLYGGLHSCGFSGDGTPATSSQLNHPSGVAVDKKGNVYIADEYNNCVRKIDSSGIINTIASNYTGGSCTPASYYGSYSGDSGQATNAGLYAPKGITLDNKGNLYIADFYNNVIRKVDTSGIITTYAGFGDSLGFTGDGGPAVAARIINPYGIVADTVGNIYFTEYGNNRIRKVNRDGIIFTIGGNVNGAGIGASGFSGDGNDATFAKLNHPGGIVIDKNGDIIFADISNYRIRKICSFSVPVIMGGPTITNEICGNDTTNLKDMMAGGTWSSSNTSIALIDDTGHITCVSHGTDTFYYTIHPGCFGREIIKFDAPPSSITGSLFACIGDSTRYNDSVPNGRWISKTAKAIISDSGWLNGTSIGTDTVMYILNNACGNDTVSDVINVYQTLVAGIITGPSVVCTGDSILLSDTIPGGTWQVSSPNATVSAGNVKGISVGIITVSYTVANSCGTSVASQVVSINPMPYAGAIICDSNICTGIITTLYDSVLGGAWSGSNDHAIVSDNGVLYGFTGGADTISYTFVNSCGTIVTTRPVTLNLLKDAGTIKGNNSGCKGSTLTLTDTVTGGYWLSQDSAIATVADGVVKGITAGTTLISYIIDNTCRPSNALQPVSIETFPFAGSIIANTNIICPGISITLSGTAPGGIWSCSNNSTAIDPGGIATGVFPGNDTILFSVANSCGRDTSSYNITVKPIPSAPLINGLNVTCIGNNPDTLTGDPPGGLWYGSNNNAAITGGVVTGLSPGIDTISYAFNDICGYFYKSLVVNVHTQNECDSIFGIQPDGELYKVYPNPAYDKFTVTTPYTGSNSTIIIMDICGRIMETKNAEKGVDAVLFNCDGFASGIYQVKIISNNNYYIRKLVVL